MVICIKRQISTNPLPKTHKVDQIPTPFLVAIFKLIFKHLGKGKGLEGKRREERIITYV